MVQIQAGLTLGLAGFRMQAGELRFMRVTERSLAVDLNESIRFLLADKGGAVCTVSPEATVFDAIKIMSEERIGSLVVLSAGRLVGIVTWVITAQKETIRHLQNYITGSYPA